MTMTKKQILKALRELKALDVREYRRVVGEAVIRMECELRFEGVEHTTEFLGDMYPQ